MISLKETKSSDVCSIGAFWLSWMMIRRQSILFLVTKTGNLAFGKKLCRHVRLVNAFVSHQFICVQVYCQPSLINYHIYLSKSYQLENNHITVITTLHSICYFRSVNDVSAVMK